jgi:hypothetical protein
MPDYLCFVSGVLRIAIAGLYNVVVRRSELVPRVGALWSAAEVPLGTQYWWGPKADEPAYATATHSSPIDDASGGLTASPIVGPVLPGIPILFKVR